MKSFQPKMFSALKKLKCLKKRTISVQDGDCGIQARFNPAYFPGLFMKSPVGTLITFESGKYNIVGTKCQQQAENLHFQALAYIRIL